MLRSGFPPPEGVANVNAAHEEPGSGGVEESLAPCHLVHSINYCEQGIDGAAHHRPERCVAFNAARLPIRRIVAQYGDVARAALCAFERDGSIFARDVWQRTSRGVFITRYTGPHATCRHTWAPAFPENFSPSGLDRTFH